MNTMQQATNAKSQMADGKTRQEPLTLRRLAKGFYFTFPNEPDRVWEKTGQRSARRCHYIKQRVARFHGWEPVVLYQNPEVI